MPLNAKVVLLEQSARIGAIAAKPAAEVHVACIAAFTDWTFTAGGKRRRRRYLHLSHDAGAKLLRLACIQQGRRSRAEGAQQKVQHGKMRPGGPGAPGQGFGAPHWKALRFAFLQEGSHPGQGCRMVVIRPSRTRTWGLAWAAAAVSGFFGEISFIRRLE